MVYIEEVAIVNFLINGTLLTLSCLILKLARSRIRVVASAIIGATFAVCLPFVKEAVWVYKIATLIATTMFAAKFGSVKKYLFFVLVFSAASFLAGGAAYAFLGFDLVYGRMLAYNAHKGVKAAVIGGNAFLWVIAWETGRFAARRRISGLNAGVCEVIVGKECKKLKCFNDTGNLLVDGMTGKGVAILSRDEGKSFLDKTERYIDVRTVNSVKACPVFVADKIVFRTSDGGRTYSKVPVAIADTNFDGCQLIYNAGALKGDI